MYFVLEIFKARVALSLAMLMPSIYLVAPRSFISNSTDNYFFNLLIFKSIIKFEQKTPKR